jgi:hypothetical protein
MRETMNTHDDKPRRPSSYATACTEALLRKIETHKQMIASIKRELTRRGVVVEDDQAEDS